MVHTLLFPTRRSIAMPYVFTNIIALTVVVATLSIPATAQIALHGYFIARAQCPAFQSFRQQTKSKPLGIHGNGIRPPHERMKRQWSEGGKSRMLYERSGYFLALTT